MMGSTGNGLQLDRATRARQHNHALVALARRVWDSSCSFDSALAVICETAAETLSVERVNIWRAEEAGRILRCIHGYVSSIGKHNPPGYNEVLHLDANYASLLGEVRVIDIADVHGDGVTSSEDELITYLRRHNIHSLLDAPVRTEGDLLGVVCHEHIGSARLWTPEDEAFAGSIGDYVGVALEISRRREAEQRMRYLERHDPHTNLPNRDHMLEVAHSALRPMHNEETGIVVVHLQVDVSHTTGYADTESHRELLAIAADQLREAIGEQAALARVRDDAFAVIPHRALQEFEALEMAERCIDVLQARFSESEHPAMVSAGIAFSRDLAAPSADALLRNAENASQFARRHGFNRCEIFDADRHRGLITRLRTEQALRDAFAENKLEVHYMPEIDERNGRWHAAEALLRWRGDDGRMIPAGEFIEIAEASGLMVRLGRWVLHEACRTACQWPQDAQGRRPLLHVNVSARQFEQAGLVADVEAALTESGLQPEQLCLELTETMLLRDREAVAKMLVRLRNIGVRIALDDFGKGFCSLGYLKYLPIDKIKIDRGFTAGLPDNRVDLAIVRALALLAEQLNIKVVAEGVEHQAQVDCLRDCGIHSLQGYLYSPAVDNATLLAKFANRA